MTILDADLDERVIAQNALTSATEHLKSLSSSHAPTFVAVECRENNLKSALSSLLTSLIENRPKVEVAQESLALNKNKADKKSEAKNAASSLAMLADRHRLRRRTLLQHSSLLELLELPSLMDACVRSNDLYDEALSIAAFANTLERRHLSTSENSGIVENVVAEIRRRELDLKRQLLARLRGDVTMPQCLEVVASLRRLNGVELERAGTSYKGSSEDLENIYAAMELRLQVDFFEARDAWLDSPASTSANISDMKIVGHSDLLLESIERYRTRCFEIATQFLAIFRTSSFNAKSSNADLSLLSLWTTRRVQIFLTSLTKQISKIDNSAALRDAIDATIFFANSMGRIGADFQSLLPPIFEPQLVNIVVSHWESGVKGLQKTFKICREAGVASPLFAIMNTENSDISKEDLHKDITTSSSAPGPPRQLLSLPPLARFLNSYLTGLNELRRCLLPGTFSSLRQCLNEIIDETRNILEANHKLVHTPGLKGEATKLREVAKDLRTQFEACVEPYCRSSLDIAFGTIQEKSIMNEEEKESNTEEKEDGEGIHELSNEGEKAEPQGEQLEKANDEECENNEEQKEGETTQNVEEAEDVNPDFQLNEKHDEEISESKEN